MPFTQLNESSETSIVRFLTADGTLTGLSNIIADYSVANQSFFSGPPVNQVWRVKSIFVSMIASGGFNGAGYAGASTALTNGLLFTINSPSIVSPVISNFQRNSDFQSIGNVVEQIAYQSNAFGLKMALNYEFFGMPGIILDGDAGNIISVLARDNFADIGLNLSVQRVGFYGGVI